MKRIFFFMICVFIDKLKFYSLARMSSDILVMPYWVQAAAESPRVVPKTQSVFRLPESEPTTIASVRVRRVDWLATQDHYVFPADSLPRADRCFDWCARIFDLCWLADQTKYPSAGARRAQLYDGTIDGDPAGDRPEPRHCRAHDCWSARRARHG